MFKSEAVLTSESVPAWGCPRENLCKNKAFYEEEFCREGIREGWCLREGVME